VLVLLLLLMRRRRQRRPPVPTRSSGSSCSSRHCLLLRLAHAPPQLRHLLAQPPHLQPRRLPQRRDVARQHGRTLDGGALGLARALGVAPRVFRVAPRVRGRALEVGEARLVKEGGEVALGVGGVAAWLLMLLVWLLALVLRGSGGRGERASIGGGGGLSVLLERWRRRRRLCGGRVKQPRVQLVRGRVVRRDRRHRLIFAAGRHCMRGWARGGRGGDSPVARWFKTARADTRGEGFAGGADTGVVVEVSIDRWMGRGVYVCDMRGVLLSTGVRRHKCGSRAVCRAVDAADGRRAGPPPPPPRALASSCSAARPALPTTHYQASSLVGDQRQPRI
jgi:hypothetical protein